MSYDELMAVDAYLENWKAWAQKFTDRLLDSGISQETIKGIELFDAGECVAMPLKSANGIIPSGSMEAEGLALCRWLIEHNADERSSRFRENEKRLTEVLLTLNQIETSGDVEKGRKFTGNKRGLSALYREVVKILETHGVDTSAKDVWDALAELAQEDDGVIQEVTDDEVFLRGKDKPTQRRSFDNQLGKIKALFKTE